MSTLREDILDRVAYALQLEVPEADSHDVRARAEALIAIAEHYRVEIDPVLLRWCHYRVPGKEWSGDEWTRFCARYAADRTELARLAGIEKLDAAAIEPERDGARCDDATLVAAAPSLVVTRMLCPRCYAHEALLTESGRWICPSCGEIE